MWTKAQVDHLIRKNNKNTEVDEERAHQPLSGVFVQQPALPRFITHYINEHFMTCKKSYAQTVLLYYSIKTNRLVPVSFLEKP
ncbi:hypothetical protein, partial [Marinithermofilum abyssi]|uniref:hypothetical protein n=1 Tax=Marinithermofilum abyssi TaxID=1571185 RepID=UPI001E466416